MQARNAQSKLEHLKQPQQMFKVTHPKELKRFRNSSKTLSDFVDTIISQPGFVKENPFNC